MTKEEKLEQETAVKDMECWKQLERFIPKWNMFGWSGRSTASFATGNYGMSSTIQLTGPLRDDIVNAFEKIAAERGISKRKRKPREPKKQS
jgi:hypothetical protein